MKDVCHDSDGDVTVFNRYLSSLVSDINVHHYGGNGAEPALFADTQIEQSVFRFADEHGLKAKLVSDLSEIRDLALPAVVKRTDGRYILVIRASHSGVLLFDQFEAKTSIISNDQFMALWSGHGIVFHNIQAHGQA